MELLRINASGTLDTGFGKAGYARVRLRISSGLAVAAGADGSLVISGPETGRPKDGRYLAKLVNGRSDRNFGRKGRIAVPIGNFLRAGVGGVLAVGPSGSIYLATPGDTFGLSRYNATGKLLSRFPKKRHRKHN
jgi:hypothetical protein